MVPFLLYCINVVLSRGLVRPQAARLRRASGQSLLKSSYGRFGLRPNAPPALTGKRGRYILACVVIPAQVSYNIYINYGTETENNTMTEKKEVQLFTDGACSGNPGPGGWGAILRYKGQEKELSGGEPMTTNNRMELLAAIEGLSALKQPCRVTLTSDSKYLVDAITKGWVYGWQKKGWKKSDNSPALNVDLWERLLPLLKYHEVEFVWVKGHAGHPENERCDRLAVAWYQSYQAGCAAKMSE